ncbi:uncharacterized protein LOC116029968 [Ipomoea triloba]|uniref:uncharacterized protein LOC116029968 n=1 Tax=Ipomoea triloba TaxID=35885 RepID=UPI00125D7705|nr:uncharacterized protein LOC116029968 [Ipomoea triloba]
MEGNKQSGSSLTSDLFGVKDSSGSSPSTLFGSIFAPPSKDAMRPEMVSWKQDPGTQVWNAKGSEVASQWTQSKDTSLFYQEQKSQPSSLCSSIYYGGQDIYPHPQNNKSECSTYKKDIGEDEQGSVSRGNWWKGSFYY